MRKEEYDQRDFSQETSGPSDGQKGIGSRERL